MSSDNIRYIDFEISSICNANCPVCVRTNDNGQFEEFKQTYWSLDEVKRVLDEKLIKQLYGIIFCGNFGDPMGNPHIADIVEYISTINPSIRFDISTNGGIGNKKLYERIGKYNVNLVLGLDGVGKKNELHRVNVKWDKVLENVYAFLSNLDNPNLNLEVQHIIWNETIDQLLPIVEFVQSLGTGLLYLRKPYGDELNNVFDMRGNYTHSLTYVKDERIFPFYETHWNFKQLPKLKEKLKKLNIENSHITKIDFIPLDLESKKVNIDVKKSKINEDDIKAENEKLNNITHQSCFSINNINHDDLTKNNHNIYITHDKNIMPCCYMPPYLYKILNGKQKNEGIREGQLVNKMIDIGLDEFNLKNKTIREVFDSGVIDKFVYNDLREGNASLFCKEKCGKCSN